MFDERKNPIPARSDLRWQSTTWSTIVDGSSRPQHSTFERVIEPCFGLRCPYQGAASPAEQSFPAIACASRSSSAWWGV